MSEKNCIGKCQIKNMSPRESGGEVREIANENGQFRTTTYSVFSGIDLVYNDAHISNVKDLKPIGGNVIEINHCREGRMECHYRDEFCYVAPGDLVIGRAGEKSDAICFPLNHYHGITVRIDIEKAPACLSCFLEDVNVCPQVELAKSVSEYLAENMDHRVTLEQLSENFHISGTQIKNVFKGVYGVSLYAYTRALKMESAAYMLEYTDRTVMDIAGDHGYDNSSKFARAFREVKGVTPSEYRKENKK